MTGSLQIKNNKYYAVLNLKIDGKRKQKWIDTELTVKSTKKERDKKLREIITYYENNTKLLTSTDLFTDYLTLWLKETKIKVDYVTYQHYESEVNTHIYPYFDNLKIKLVDVDRAVLQKYFVDKYENGRIDGKGGLSPTTLRHHRNVINQTLNLALKNGVIVQNPCQFVTLPQNTRYNYDFFNLEEINEFLNAIK